MKSGRQVLVGRYLGVPIYMLEDLMPERDPLLVERQATHGDFKMNAFISQGIKTIMASADGYPTETVFREALDMIALKISRICSGQANFKDHWDDIAGYAKLASDCARDEN